MSANGEDLVLPTLGTSAEEVAQVLKSDPEQRVTVLREPHCVVRFPKGEAIQVEAFDMEGVPLVMLERASMMLIKEVLRVRQTAARTKPKTHNAGWGKPEVKHASEL